MQLLADKHCTPHSVPLLAPAGSGVGCTVQALVAPAGAATGPPASATITPIPVTAAINFLSIAFSQSPSRSRSSRPLRIRRGGHVIGCRRGRQPALVYS